MAVSSVNECTGSYGFIPTLLVFEAFPRFRLPRDRRALSVVERAVDLQKATVEMSGYLAKRQIEDALNARNGLKAADIHSTPIGLFILVYHPKNDKQKGPFSLSDINREAVMVST